MAAPLKLTPIEAWARAHNARLIEIGGWRCAGTYGEPEAEAAHARGAVALADTTPHGKVQIEGERAADLVRVAFGLAPNHAGAGLRASAGFVYCLRPDLYYLSTPPGGDGQALQELEQARAAVPGLLTLTDLSHGLADLCLVGPRSRDVLSKVCALDVSAEAFPNLTARQTSVARTRQMVVRRDLGALPAFSIVGAASLAGYLWEVLLEAGREFSLRPIGTGALRILETE